MLICVLVCFLFLLVFFFHGLIDDPRFVKLYTYPALLGHDCRLSILTEISGPIMHYTAIIVRG